MGLYTPRNTFKSSFDYERDMGPESLYNLAKRLGANEEEAQALKRGPEKEVSRFLIAKKQRMEKEGANLPKPPPRKVSGNYLHDLERFASGLFGTDVGYALRLRDEPSQDPGAQTLEEDIPTDIPEPAPSPTEVGPPESYATNFQTPGGAQTPTFDPSASLAAAAELDPVAGQPEEAEKDGSGRRMALAIMEGLTRAGAEASNVPSIIELKQGLRRRPTDHRAGDQLAKVRELDLAKEEERKQEKIDAENPIVKLVNEKYGTNAKTPKEAAQILELKKTESVLSTEEFKRGEGPSAEKMREEKLHQDRQKAINSVRKERREIQKLKSFQKFEESLSHAKGVLELLATGNVSDAQNAGISLARAAGEVGNLAQAEQTRYINMPGLKGIADRIKAFAQSEPTEENRERLRELARHYMERAGNSMNDLLSRETDAYLEANPDIDADFVRSQFKSLAPKSKGGTILMEDPDGENPPMRVPENEYEMWKEAGWVDG